MSKKQKLDILQDDEPVFLDKNLIGKLEKILQVVEDNQKESDFLSYFYNFFSIPDTEKFVTDIQNYLGNILLEFYGEKNITTCDDEYPLDTKIYIFFVDKNSSINNVQLKHLFQYESIYYLSINVNGVNPAALSIQIHVNENKENLNFYKEKELKEIDFFKIKVKEENGTINNMTKQIMCVINQYFNIDKSLKPELTESSTNKNKKRLKIYIFPPIVMSSIKKMLGDAFFDTFEFKNNPNKNNIELSIELTEFVSKDIIL